LSIKQQQPIKNNNFINNRLNVFFPEPETVTQAGKNVEGFLIGENLKEVFPVSRLLLSSN